MVFFFFFFGDKDQKIVYFTLLAPYTHYLNFFASIHKPIKKMQKIKQKLKLKRKIRNDEKI
jgi:hypothetical protein